jgi:hypothetical protein
VPEGEHPGHTFPMQQLADIHAPFTQVLVCRRGVGACKADAGLNTGRNAVVAGDQGERGGRARRGNSDPAPAKLR